MSATFEFMSAHISFAMLATYVPLFAGILAFFISDQRLAQKVALTCGVVSIVMALFAQLITPEALPSIAALAGACYALKRYPKLSILWIGIIAYLSVALATHEVSGFNNPMMFIPLKLSPNSHPYVLYLNFDKAILGLILLSFMRQQLPVETAVNRLQLTGFCVAISFAGLLLAVVGGLIAWEPKLPEVFGIWALSNLFITCVAEEAFFRGFIQRLLQQRLQKMNKPPIIAVVFTGVLFGVAHAGGGPLFVVIAALAGFGYGYVYYKTGQLRWAIAFHFIFNSLHMIFFTYPLLDKWGTMT